MERPSAILLDLAGTTTDLALVSRRLAAFLTAPTSAQSYLRETFDRPETKELVRRLREARGGATEEEQAQRKSSLKKNILSVLFTSSFNLPITFQLPPPSSSNPLT